MAAFANDNVSASLPTIDEYVPPISLPLPVIAHMIYGHMENYDDLKSRNTIRNPIATFQTLEVLLDS